MDGDEFNLILTDALSKQVDLLCVEVRGLNAEILYHRNDQLISTRTLWNTAMVNRFAGSIYALIVTDRPNNKIIDKHYQEFERWIDTKKVRFRVTTIPAHPNGFDCIVKLYEITD